MSKKAKRGGGGASLGRSLINDRNKSNRRGKDDGKGWLHSCDLEDGYEWGRLNLQSVTEQSRLDEFLSTAELAGIEFKAEKLNIKVVSTGVYTGLPTEQERADARKAEEENVQYLSIPRRPQWDSSTSPEQLELLERDSFLKWRRSLNRLQEDDRLTLTPFEKNLEFWRQLWRVVEKSDILVQIVDARNPLLFRCEDLEKYVLEISPLKVNMILISKADLLTLEQRRAWRDYFRDNTSIVIAFWSALLESEGGVTEGEGSTAESSLEGEDSSPERAGSEVVTDGMEHGSVFEGSSLDRDVPPDVAGPLDPATPLDVAMTPIDRVTHPDATTPNDTVRPDVTTPTVENKTADDCRLLSGDELTALFLEISPVSTGSLTTVGMVGYPNVGKSSTINALFQGKKVPVSATPGRTKHFQTLFLRDDLMLCDCPGLVFPSFLSSKAEMVCSGILPIDQLRDHIPPISLVCERIPRHVLERTYGIEIPLPGEGEDQDRPPYARELLSAYGCMRGYMTSHGQPDEPRSARYILKDYVNGKLSYCLPPPGVDGRLFNHQHIQLVSVSGGVREQSCEGSCDGSSSARPPPRLGQFDAKYFRQERTRAITKGVAGSQRSATVQGEGKSWKKHNNRNKKEKTRRTVLNS